MFKVAIITSSDSGYKGEREDRSGLAIRKIVEENGYEVVQAILLPDEKDILSDGRAADLILTKGGTGFSPRDCMPESLFS